MAQTIVAPKLGNFISGPGQVEGLADQTTTTANFAPTNAFVNVTVQIAQKTFVAGTGTALPRYRIQVADDSAFTTNARTIGTAYAERADNSHIMLTGMCLDGAKDNVRIVPVLDGTDTVTFDSVMACS
mgnify:CR=1 FL=1